MRSWAQLGLRNRSRRDSGRDRERGRGSSSSQWGIYTIPLGLGHGKFQKGSGWMLNPEEDYWSAPKFHCPSSGLLLYKVKSRRLFIFFKRH